MVCSQRQNSRFCDQNIALGFGVEAAERVSEKSEGVVWEEHWGSFSPTLQPAAATAQRSKQGGNIRHYS